MILYYVSYPDIKEGILHFSHSLWVSPKEVVSPSDHKSSEAALHLSSFSSDVTFL